MAMAANRQQQLRYRRQRQQSALAVAHNKAAAQQHKWRHTAAIAMSITATTKMIGGNILKMDFYLIFYY